jgi:hypothetical protein
MRLRFLCSFALFGSVVASLVGGSVTALAGAPPVGGQNAVAGQNGGDFSQNADATPVPAGVLIVKGAWSSASDSVTPLPEGGRVAEHDYSNAYFALNYPPPAGWIQGYDGPPPSDTGFYVLAQIQPAASLKGTSGTVLITAQDMFFAAPPARDPLGLLLYTRDHLQADYKVEQPIEEVRIGDHGFARLAYTSPVAKLHWTVLATQIRCHTVAFVYTSRDSRLIGGLVQAMSKMTLSGPGGSPGETGTDSAPVCIKDYASAENVITRVDPMFSERRANPIPVRVIIDVKGKVKHVHIISGFPDQAKSITDALSQWRFKPYLKDGQAVEVETGILFGRAAARLPATLAADDGIKK